MYDRRAWPLSGATHNLHAILFDVDGTLADTEEYHRQAFNEAFSEFGLDWHWSPEEYTELLATSGGRERIRAYAARHLTPRPAAESVRDLALRVHARKSAIYRDKLDNGHIGLRPGVLRLLQNARATGVHCAIATSTSSFNVETLLGHALDLPIRDYFESVVTSDIVVDKKPSPAVYQYAMAELGLAPEQCLAIEDTASGNRAARAADLQTIITMHRFTRHHDFRGATLVLDSLGNPDQPFHVHAGDARGATFVDIDLLDALLSDDHEPRPGQDWQPDAMVMAK